MAEFAFTSSECAIPFPDLITCKLPWSSSHHLSVLVS
jgi:hypothetical protein